MLSLDDCIGLCSLTEEEVRAIAEHEGVPEIIACEMAEHLVRTADGQQRIKRIILEDIEAARARDDFARSAQLKLVLEHFVDTHPAVH